MISAIQAGAILSAVIGAVAVGALVRLAMDVLSDSEKHRDRDRWWPK